MIETRRLTLGQVLICLGCCCGRTDKGKPSVPADWLKAEWKRHALLKHVHLNVTGCLGPCEIANIVAIATPDATHWFGRLDEQHYYQALLDGLSRRPPRDSCSPCRRSSSHTWPNSAWNASVPQARSAEVIGAEEEIFEMNNGCICCTCAAISSASSARS